MIAPDIIQASPHFNTAAPSRKQVVLHATRSGVSAQWPQELLATLNHFANPYQNNPESRASAHWVIGYAGEKARVVPDTRQAWHAGEDNLAFGIEICQSLRFDPFTDAQIDALVDVCAGYCTDFGVPAVHVTSSSKDGFIGHEESDHGRRVGKTDPGTMFPWVSFIDKLRAKLHPMGPGNEQPPFPGTGYSADERGQALHVAIHCAEQWSLVTYGEANLKAKLKGTDPAMARRFARWILAEIGD